MRLLTLLLLSWAAAAQSAYIATGNASGYTDSTGQLWTADNGVNCTGGTVFHSGTAVSGTPDQTLYQYGRSGTGMSCTAAVGSGIFAITLKYADVLGFTAPGQQIFNIFVNGTLQRANFDIFNTVRAQNTAYDVVIPAYANLAGNIIVTVQQISSGTQGAQLQAISIIPSAASSTNWITGVFNKPFVDSRQFIFAPQTPGVSLTAATPVTITMSPCPIGVAGTDVGHYLYISGGTGTAEAVLITGGTCVSGGSGNITFTPTNNHSGSWTLSSASDGIQEACNSLLPTLWYQGAPLPVVFLGAFLGSGGGIVYVPVGTHKIYGTITLPGNVTLQGVTSEGTILQSQGMTIVQTWPTSVRSQIFDMGFDLNHKNNIIGLDLHSVSDGNYQRIFMSNGDGSTGSTDIRFFGDASGNSVNNTLRDFRAEWGADKGLVFEGTGTELVPVGAATLNHITHVRIAGTTGPLIEFIRLCDSNTFDDIKLIIGPTGDGIIYNSGDPLNSNGVGNEVFNNVVTEGSSTGTALKFFASNQDTITRFVNTAFAVPIFYITGKTTNTRVIDMSGFNIGNGTESIDWQSDGWVLGNTVAGIGSFMAINRVVLNVANGANQNIDILGGSYSVITTPTGGFSVGGFAGGRDGRILYLYNSTAQQMTISDEAAGSTAANRITTLTGADVILRAGRSYATFIYDGISSRWILTSTN